MTIKIAALRTFVSAATLTFVLAAERAHASPILDVLILHDPGTSTASAVGTFEASTNGILENSDIDMQVRFVDEVAYTITGNTYIDALESLMNDTAVANLRHQHGADIVAYVGPEYATQVCGVAVDKNLVPSSAYTITSTHCGALTFAHEIGHVLGLGHSYQQNDTGYKYTYGRGHGVQGSFVTIMAYPSAYGVPRSDRVATFSNPGKTCTDNHPCGIATGLAGEAFAALAVNKITGIATSFRGGPNHSEEIYIGWNNLSPFGIQGGRQQVLNFPQDIPNTDTIKIRIYQGAMHNWQLIATRYVSLPNDFSYTFTSNNSYLVYASPCLEEWSGYECDAALGYVLIDAI